MDPEEKKLLEEAVKLGEENNKMLRSLYRSMRVRRVMSIVYWIFIIGSAVGAYYFIEPYVDGIRESYGRAQEDVDGFKEFFQKLNDNLPR